MALCDVQSSSFQLAYSGGNLNIEIETSIITNLVAYQMFARIQYLNAM